MLSTEVHHASRHNPSSQKSAKHHNDIAVQIVQAPHLYRSSRLLSIVLSIVQSSRSQMLRKAILTVWAGPDTLHAVIFKQAQSLLQESPRRVRLSYIAHRWEFSC